MAKRRLLPLAAALLLTSLPGVRAAAPDGAMDGAAGAPDGAVDSSANAHVLDLLESRAASTAAAMKQTSAHHRALQSQFDAKLHSLQRIRDLVKYELGGLHKHLLEDQSADSSASSLGKLYEDMDVLGEKMVELIRRTEGVVGRVGEYNLWALRGDLDGALDAAKGEVQGEEWEEGEEGEVGAATKTVPAKVGLKDRLVHVRKEEVRRRTRFHSQREHAASDEESDASAGDACTVGGNATAPYVSLSALEAQFAPETVLGPSEAALQAFFAELADQSVQRRLAADQHTIRSRQQELPKMYQGQYAKLDDHYQTTEVESQCLAVSKAMEVVGAALGEHYRDGTGLIDHARYDNGGSVAYELTSGPYVPSPRVDEGMAGEGQRMAYARGKQEAFDAQTEEMYHMHKALLRQSHDGVSEFFEGANVWQWFATFRFEAFRPYLPQDWERLLDAISEKLGARAWSDHTPRGALDALVPDYVYRALGMGNDPAFGKVYGRTAGPEVALSSGRDKSGGSGGGGWTAKPLGHCYPLSMRPEDDPAVSLLGPTDEDMGASLLVGPKYTVRLPYPVHIDAVTVEHRSFPLAPQAVAGGVRGGESAPRWVRAVGFPPCPASASEEDECGVRGFDMNRPIDLGSFEYRPITVTGREDDYGGADEEEGADEKWASQGGRRRSVQTFAVKGGKWTPSPRLGNDVSDDSATLSEEADAAQSCSLDDLSCSVPSEEEDEPEPDVQPGQCAPPKDEDSEPSCGDDAPASSSRSSGAGSGGVRHVVEAVSFVFEENWGNSAFTCLYRVRVHGDAVTV